MCGICGKLNLDRRATTTAEVVKAMADAIVHRGPDDEGYYVSGPVGLGFRRLSIIDLNTGHQPISNEDGTVWIAFNGEIYNYQELRTQLQNKGHKFSTQTDTEVIVHLYEEFGEECISKLRGMFAFAIWDDRQQVLLVARDRLGIKPLYYWRTGKSVVFASEIKAILADPEVNPEVIPSLVDRFLTFYYMPGEETLLRNIRKLPPASYLLVRAGQVQVKSYWDLHYSPTEQPVVQAEEELLRLLEESVKLHMIADVPVGFLLSGGVDSTAMLDFAVGKTDQALSSFTIGFADPGLDDERPYARLAAKKYGTSHYETTITAQEFADFMPKYSWYMEEPVCEPHAIALYYVSRLAKDFVKVLISGEGGDEAFAGYQTYRGIFWLERWKGIVPQVNGTLSATLSQLNRVFRSDRLEKYGPLMRLPLEEYYYSRTSSPFRYFNAHATDLYSREFAAYADKNDSLAPINNYLALSKASGTINRMLYVDTKTSLPDDLLLKADKMTMANSIELRVPFLDHKVMEFAATLPENFKVRGITTKYIAKQALRHRLPRQILERRKAGFPVPYESWLRTDLKDWIRDVLLDRETVSRGYFNRGHIEKMIVENSNLGGLSRELFSLAALELWHRAFLTSNKAEMPAPPDFLVGTSKAG